MKITPNFEISNVTRIVVDRDYVWELHCDSNGNEVWILNAESDVVDDTSPHVPQTHFKTCNAMCQFVRDKYNGGKYRLYVPAIDEEDIEKGYTGVQINLEQIGRKPYIYSGVKLVDLPPKYENHHNKQLISKMQVKLDKFRRKNVTPEKTEVTTFKKFQDYFKTVPIATGEDIIAYGEGGGCNNLYGCLKKSNKPKNTPNIDWIK